MDEPDNKFREGKYGPRDSTAEKAFLREKLNKMQGLTRIRGNVLGTATCQVVQKVTAIEWAQPVEGCAGCIVHKGLQMMGSNGG